MNFEKKFEDWLSQGLQTDIPETVKAFSFNLFETASVEGIKFGIELIGASEFDENDPDWACDEVWEPKQRQLNIPIEYSGQNWEKCLERMKTLVSKLVQGNKEYVFRLKESMGVGIGFVDGDIEIVWQP